MHIDIAKQFLSALYGDRIITTRSIHDKTKQALPARCGTITTILQGVQDDNSKGYGTFCAVNCSGVASTADADIKDFTACFIDIDDPVAPTSFGLQPSCILRRADGGGYHIYWLLSGGHVDADTWRTTQKALIRFYRSDPAIHNPARLMRIAGTLHTKGDAATYYDIQELHPTQRYTCGDILLAHTDVDKLIDLAYKDACASITDKLVDGDGRHAIMIRAAYICRDYGLSADDTRTVLTRINDNKFADKYDDTTLTSFIRAQKHARGERGEKAIEREKKEEARRERVRAALSTWYYVRSLHMFIDAVAPDRRISERGFNAKFSHLADCNNVAGYVFREDLIAQVEGVTYSPAAPRVIVTSAGAMLNMWVAPACAPVTNEPRWFVEHMRYLIPDEAERAHVLSYIAYLVQNPGAKVMHALLLIGKQGTGKSILQLLLSTIFGDANVAVPHNENLSGAYTGWAKHCQLVWINELSQIDKRDFNNKIKPFITERTVEIREMYTPPYSVPNHLNIIAVSNHTNPLYIDQDDRRWFVVSSPAEQQSAEYYKQLVYNIEHNAGEVLHYLLTYDTSAFDAGARPTLTKAKMDIVQYSKSDLELWIEQAIMDGEECFARDAVTIAEIKDALPYTLRNGYATSNRIGRILRELGCVMLDPMRINGRVQRLCIVRDVDKYMSMHPDTRAATLTSAREEAATHALM